MRYSCCGLSVCCCGVSTAKRILYFWEAAVPYGENPLGIDPNRTAYRFVVRDWWVDPEEGTYIPTIIERDSYYDVPLLGDISEDTAFESVEAALHYKYLIERKTTAPLVLVKYELVIQSTREVVTLE